MPRPPPIARRKLLVLGKDDRAFLAVVRSLGRAGHEVHIAWHDPTSLALHSRYVHQAHAVERSEHEHGAWVEEMAALFERERFDLVVPTNDPSLFALLAQRARFEPLAKLLAPNRRCLEVAFDKLSTWQLARELGLSVPEQVRLERVEDALERVAEWGWPIVLKPRLSFAFGRDKWEQQVRKARNEKELATYFAVMSQSGEVLAQRHVDGAGIGVDVLAHKGEVLEWFMHRRLHQPPDGGSSSLRRSEALDPALAEQVMRLARALELSTLAMFEFKRPLASARANRAGAEVPAAWLLEINARPWGSLPLALCAKADFPAAWVELALQGTHRAWPAPRTDLASRNWSMDRAWWRANRRAPRGDASYEKVGWRQLAGEFARAARGLERSDAFALDDPRPARVECARLLREGLSSARRRVERAVFELGPLGAARARALRARVALARRVLFVCKGNLCRSAFAGILARQTWPVRIEIGSAGTQAQPGKPSPRAAQEHAARFGVDLFRHRSRRLCSDDVERADLIFVFDRANQAALERDYPRAAPKVHYCGALDGALARPIEDPLGGDFADYQRCFARIQRCLAMAAESLRAPQAALARSTAAPRAR